MKTFFTQKVKGQTLLWHRNVLEFFIDLDPEVLVRVHPLHFLSLGDNQDRRPPVPLVVHHKLIGFADTELQVIVVAPCGEALYQSSVLFCKNMIGQEGF